MLSFLFWVIVVLAVVGHKNGIFSALAARIKGGGANKVQGQELEELRDRVDQLEDAQRGLLEKADFDTRLLEGHQEGE